jgi:prepilin-type N-terminal cleavage/methylation domain-containing protein
MQTRGNQGRRGGFTLVEVVVVAVITLILAAVAIPMYNGYVQQARQDTVDNLAETAAAAAHSFWRKTNVTTIATPILPNMGVLNLHFDSARHTVGVSGSYIIVTDARHTNVTALRSFRN